MDINPIANPLHNTDADRKPINSIKNSQTEDKTRFELHRRDIRKVFARRLSLPLILRTNPNELYHGDQLAKSNRTKSGLTANEQIQLNQLRHFDQAFRPLCNRQQAHQAHQMPDSSSASSTSSSSGSNNSNSTDSAFSQSQTTLGSNSSSLKSNAKRKFTQEQKPGAKGKLDQLNKKMFYPDDVDVDDDDDSTSTSGSSSDPIGQFKIVWRNLTYRIPEKRLSRLVSNIKQYKQRIWPTSEPTELNFSQQPEEDVADSRPLYRSKRLIFKDLNGCAKSGELSAVLGPSGAGKTTLLECLSNRLSHGVSGQIDIQGGGEAKRRLKLCIIPQKDYLFDNLTVMENLLFASRIKNTGANFEHLKNVQRVSSLLGLQSCLKLKTSNLSGGQHKRVSIAQELLSNPDVLILDEPTSGLDSRTCFRTVSVLQDLVNMSRQGFIQPLAIIMTIHQPQVKIFNLFHQVYIMSTDGQCIYQGKPEYLIETAVNCCNVLPPSEDLNPASFIIDLASGVYGRKPMIQLAELQRENFRAIQDAPQERISIGSRATAGSRGSLAETKPNQVEIFIIQEQNQENDCSSNNSSPKEVSSSSVKDNYCDKLIVSDRLRKCNSHDKSCFWLHTGLLINRLWLSMWRDPLLTTTRVTFHLIVPIIFYLIYSQKSGEANACPLIERELDIRTMTSDANIHRLEIQHNELILSFENVSLFFLLLYSFSMCVLAVTALSFPLNMQILFKETSNGWYTMPRFVMAKTIADLPIELAMPAISVSIAYFLTGQPGSYMQWRMLTITGVMTLCSLISQTQGLLFGAYFMNNVQAAVFVSQASSLPWIMLSGFTTRVSQMPAALRWLSFGSIYRLGIESIIAVRYGFGMCPCDEASVNDKPAKLVGIPDHLRSLMSYYMTSYTEGDTEVGDAVLDGKTNSSIVTHSIPGSNNSNQDVFERLASTLSRANTYGANIVSCEDVRPFILTAREVNESTLPMYLVILSVIFVALKAMLFFVVKVRAS